MLIGQNWDHEGEPPGHEGHPEVREGGPQIDPHDPRNLAGHKLNLIDIFRKF